MMTTKFRALLNEVAGKCTSVDEFKLECAVRGIPIPVEEMHFLKWFSSIAFGTKKAKAFLYPGPIEWKKRLWNYINIVVDDVMTEEKFKNLAKTDMMIKALTFDYSVTDRYLDIAGRTFEFRDNPHPSRRKRKNMLRYAWKVKNTLSMHPVNSMLMLAYAKKHGGLPF